MIPLTALTLFCTSFTLYDGPEPEPAWKPGITREKGGAAGKPRSRRGEAGDVELYVYVCGK